MPPEQVSPSLVVLGLLAMAVVAGSVAIWAIVIRRLARRAPIVVYEPRQPLPRRGTDVLMSLLAGLILVIIVRQVIGGASGTSPASQKAPTAAELASAFAVETLIVAAVVGCVMAVGGVTVRDLGFPTSRPGYDFALGGAGYLAGVVPVMLIQYGLTYTGVSYQHPLIVGYEKSPNSLMLIVSAIGAVAVAPLCEEMIFRVLLQGWFESIEASRQLSSASPLVAEVAEQPEFDAGVAPPADDTDEPAPASGPLNPYQSPQAVDAAPLVADAVQVSRPSWWPIALSSALFAMMHWGQGLAPVPLFFYAAILGYLYQRTHRLWPSLVAHSVLNGGSMLILWLATKPPG